MAQFTKNQSLNDLQLFIQEVYGQPDDRMFSLSDLLSNQERFTMRALKGIRKNDEKKIVYNLLIALSWQLAVANRLHISLEEHVWRRFPGVCSYCGGSPCECRAKKPEERMVGLVPNRGKPNTLSELQGMFESIYPAASRTLADAGVHLAEEMGEVNEAVHIFLGEHQDAQFKNIEDEIADYVSCIFGVANSMSIDMASEFKTMYTNNCHMCHEAPCACNFSSVATFKS